MRINRIGIKASSSRHLLPALILAQRKRETRVVTLGLPPDDQTVLLASANQTGKEIERLRKCIERVGAIYTTALGDDMGERILACPFLFGFRPTDPSHYQLTGGRLTSDAKMQFAFESKGQCVHSVPRLVEPLVQSICVKPPGAHLSYARYGPGSRRQTMDSRLDAASCCAVLLHRFRTCAHPRKADSRAV